MNKNPLIESASHSDVGAKRVVNEDAVLEQYPCYLVADGMGGHDAGDVASQTAISAFAEIIPAGKPANFQIVSDAYTLARHRVRKLAQQSERGAGCTLSGAIMIEHDGNPTWLIINLGDSRVYQLLAGQLKQITVDHTLRDEMIERGADPDDPSLPPPNIITRALGGPVDEADTWLIPVHRASKLLICSDGLVNEIADRDLTQMLAAPDSAQAIADMLLDEALDAGARDNVSLIVVDVIDTPETPEVALEDVSTGPTGIIVE